MSDGEITLIREIEDEVYGYCVLEIEVEYNYFPGWNGGRWAMDPPESEMCEITWASHRLTDEEEQEAERIALYEHVRGSAQQPAHRPTLGFSELERIRLSPRTFEIDDYVPF